MTFLAIGIWTHVVFDKDNLGEILGFETRVFVWTSVTLAYVIIHYALLRFSFWLVHIFPRWFHLTPVASLVGILVCEPIFIHIMTHMGVFEPFSMSKIIIFVGRDIIILGLLEFIFATLIIPIVHSAFACAFFKTCLRQFRESFEFIAPVNDTIWHAQCQRTRHIGYKI